jgi:hypothetical protein
MVDPQPATLIRRGEHPRTRLRVAIVTSIHRDFDSRLWKYATSLVKMGYDVTLFCPWNIPGGQFRENVRFCTFKRANARAERWTIPARLLHKLIPALSQNEIIHFHDLDILPWMTALSLFKHVVYDVHENYPLEMIERPWIHPLLRRPLSFAVRWGQLACAQIIRNLVLVAESQENDLFGPWLRKEYVRNYASVQLLSQARSNFLARPPSVIFTGSQTRNNGCFLYLEIASIVHKKRNDVLFYATDRFGLDDAARTRVNNEVQSRGLDES